MKTRQLLVLICINFALLSFSQNFNVGDKVVFSNNVPVIESETALLFTEAENPSKTMNYLEEGVKFKVLSIGDTIVKLIAIPFKALTDTQVKKINKGSKRIKSQYYNDKIYSVSLKNFTAFAQKVEEIDRVSIGVVTLPFKARPQDDISFDTEFNLSTALNINLWNFGPISLNGQLGAGIGSVELNTQNAAGIDENEAQDVATLTMFTGLMVQFNKVQVGLYAGVDQINNQDNYQWKSNGNLWLGFGIGFDIFSISSSSAKNKQ